MVRSFIVQHYNGKPVKIEYNSLLEYYYDILHRMDVARKVWKKQHLMELSDDIELYLDSLADKGILYKEV